MMSILGTMIAQLFTITHHDAGFGYTLIGKPLATTCFAFSIGTIFVGAVRSWRHQNSMKSGQALTGGFEIHVIGVATFLVCAPVICDGQDSDRLACYCLFRVFGCNRRGQGRVCGARVTRVLESAGICLSSINFIVLESMPVVKLTPNLEKPAPGARESMTQPCGMKHANHPAKRSCGSGRIPGATRDGCELASMRRGKHGVRIRADDGSKEVE